MMHHRMRAEASALCAGLRRQYCHTVHLKPIAEGPSDSAALNGCATAQEDSLKRCSASSKPRQAGGVCCANNEGTTGLISGRACAFAGAANRRFNLLDVLQNAFGIEALAFVKQGLSQFGLLGRSHHGQIEFHQA